MKHAVVITAVVTALATAAPALEAQVPEVPPEKQVQKLPRQKLSGPRFGFTAFTGETAEARQAADLGTLMTQFGWQLETQIVSLESGNQALMEWVFLLGGVESEEYNLSVAWLAGYRTEGGLEFGVGPNFSYNPDAETTTSSMQFFGGTTLPFGEMYVPLNLGIGIADGEPRITTLLGWIVG